MNNLNYYYNIIENAIAKIGLDPQVARQKRAGQWTITKGKIPVWIDVFHIEKEGRVYFQVASPVMKMPGTDNGALAQELLELNNQLFGVAFSTNKGNVFIRTIREAEGLDINEAYSMIMRVGNYADQYDDILKQKYPGWVQANFQGNTMHHN
jgi:hypothetical protein